MHTQKGCPKTDTCPAKLPKGQCKLGKAAQKPRVALLCVRRLEFEKTAVQTLNATISQMEAAHSAREADWHELSARWMQFEKELTSDNERWVRCRACVLQPQRAPPRFWLAARCHCASDAYVLVSRTYTRLHVLKLGVVPFGTFHLLKAQLSLMEGQVRESFGCFLVPCWGWALEGLLPANPT